MNPPYFLLLWGQYRWVLSTSFHMGKIVERC